MADQFDIQSKMPMPPTCATFQKRAQCGFGVLGSFAPSYLLGKCAPIDRFEDFSKESFVNGVT